MTRPEDVSRAVRPASQRRGGGTEQRRPRAERHGIQEIPPRDLALESERPVFAAQRRPRIIWYPS
jgi:hypothetical protein